MASTRVSYENYEIVQILAGFMLIFGLMNGLRVLAYFGLYASVIVIIFGFILLQNNFFEVNWNVILGFLFPILAIVGFALLLFLPQCQPYFKSQKKILYPSRVKVEKNKEEKQKLIEEMKISKKWITWICLSIIAVYIVGWVLISVNFGFSMSNVIFIAVLLVLNLLVYKGFKFPAYLYLVWSVYVVWVLITELEYFGYSDKFDFSFIVMSIECASLIIGSLLVIFHPKCQALFKYRKLNK